MTTGTRQPMVLCDPCSDTGWERLSAARGHLFHSPSWLRALRDAYGHDPRALMTPDGGIAWVGVNDLRGSRLACLPFSDFGGPTGGGDVEALVPALQRHWTGEVPTSVRIVDGHPDYQIDRATIDLLADRLDMVGRVHHVWHWTDLLSPGVTSPVVPDRGSDATVWEETAEDPLWSALAAQARQNVRRARRSGVRVEVDGRRASLAVFEELHRSLRRRKYRLLAQPASFFDALHRHFAPDRLAVVVARIADDPVAAVVLLRHGDHGYYKFNASNSRGWASRANDLVMWTALVQARRWGCQRFDHGISDLDQPGLIRYKTKYASGQREVVTLTRPGRVGRRWWTGTVERGLSTATRLATAEPCPDWVGRRLSRSLYRLFC